MKPFSVSGKVELFPQVGGWYYVRIPKKITIILQDYAVRGLVPIKATLKTSTWNTSLLPYGDGTQFIALNAKVRKEQHINLGDKVNLTFTVRSSFKN